MKLQTLALNLQQDVDLGASVKMLLIPAGVIRGRDGRSWINDRPSEVVAYQQRLARDIVFDFEHATFLKASKGDPAPASGWVTVNSLQIDDDGAIWGMVDWNDSGRHALAQKEYRYYSPAFLYDDNGRVVGIHHIALTNRHNLFDLPALNHQLSDSSHPKETPMPLPAPIAAALKLDAKTATETDAVAAITTLQTDNQRLALNAEQTGQVDLKQFVPMETHQLAMNRASDAEGKLADQAKSQLKADAETLIDGAVDNKKIAPANRDHYLALCAEQAGFDQVKSLVEAAPVILQTEPTNLDGKQPGQQVALNSEEQEACRLLGMSTEDFLASKKEMQ
ncbi:Uncharacterised protein [BD1-7 clade bacterium]|uniref:Mu-like prophage I protein n=1 Tax=BD1-7 clade bacterium TaxID=2029982 RepID=A0A5S9Q2A7_9GAMM|nr:Uncharacterised protein [BD1-7 clade bacterium]